MTDHRDRKRENARSFGRAASKCVDSAVHRGGDGDDLQTLAAWCADADRALDTLIRSTNRRARP